jgi:hypothetical protein
MCENEDVYAARVWGEMREKLTNLPPNYKKNSDFFPFRERENSSKTAVKASTMSERMEMTVFLILLLSSRFFSFSRKTLQ